MNETIRCHLTTKDANILEVMLERLGDGDECIARLLRDKLATATITLHNGVDPRTATINSRVEFSVDGAPSDQRILVYGGESAYPGMTLPITAMRGLALLGLTAPCSIRCDRPDGPSEELRLLRVLYQPEARRSIEDPMAPGALRTAEQSSAVVVGIRRRPRRLSGRGPDGDGPGPEAA
jgi:regulator of nucleoside diphosphate kinase